jgi:hypothetical protein
MKNSLQEKENEVLTYKNKWNKENELLETKIIKEKEILENKCNKEKELLETKWNKEKDLLETKIQKMKAKHASDINHIKNDYELKLTSINNNKNDENNENLNTINNNNSNNNNNNSNNEAIIIELKNTIEEKDNLINKLKLEVSSKTIEIQQKNETISTTRTENTKFINDINKLKEIIADRERALETASKSLSENLKLYQDSTIKINDLYTEIAEKDARSRQLQSSFAEEADLKKQITKWQEAEDKKREAEKAERNKMLMALQKEQAKEREALRQELVQREARRDQEESRKTDLLNKMLQDITRKIDAKTTTQHINNIENRVSATLAARPTAIGPGGVLNEATEIDAPLILRTQTDSSRAVHYEQIPCEIRIKFPVIFLI